MTDERFAIYYSPAINSGLWTFGSHWLGRDAYSGDTLPRFEVKGVEQALLDRVTASPRHYGFHATLKPPFRLKPECSRDELVDAISDFAATRQAFEMPRLVLADLVGFLALRPDGSCSRLKALAAECVEHFDRFRRAPSEVELEKRLGQGLRPEQRRMLERWGYPYVMDEFRFHLTLTGRIGAGLRDHLRRVLNARVSSLSEVTLEMDALTLFHQSDPEQPFRVIHRSPLARESGGGLQFAAG
ncbi:MAG: DUF1045 domain-containing protein [Candidatus Sedimenticola sp. 20ELBAFRAG]